MQPIMCPHAQACPTFWYLVRMLVFRLLHDSGISQRSLLSKCDVAALLLLGFFLLHTASMVVSFEGLAAGHALYIATPPALHLVTSLLVSLH